MAESVVRLKRELRYQGTILKIYEDTVMANGHEAHWDFIHHDGAAAIIPVTEDPPESWMPPTSRRLNARTGSWRRRQGIARISWSI